MRLALKKISSEERKMFYGTFQRFGKSSRYGKTTVLLKDIADEKNNYLCDHLWFGLTKGFKDLELERGDRVSFYGRVVPYIKGYIDYRSWNSELEMDYKISYPTKVRIVTNCKKPIKKNSVNKKKNSL